MKTKSKLILAEQSKGEQILSNYQIDEIILRNNQNHLETEKFINELMNINISDDITNNSVIRPIVNLSEITENIFGENIINQTTVTIITNIIDLIN